MREENVTKSVDNLSFHSETPSECRDLGGGAGGREREREREKRFELEITLISRLLKTALNPLLRTEETL